MRDVPRGVGADPYTFSHREKLAKSRIFTSKGNDHVGGDVLTCPLHLLLPKEGLASTQNLLLDLVTFAAFSTMALLRRPFFFSSPKRDNAPLNMSGPFLVFYFNDRKIHTAAGFVGLFLKCFLLDFPRHSGEIEPGTDNPDLYLCGCNTFLAPADPLHTQAEEGKSGDGCSQLCLSPLPVRLRALLGTQKMGFTHCSPSFPVQSAAEP